MLDTTYTIILEIAEVNETGDDMGWTAVGLTGNSATTVDAVALFSSLVVKGTSGYVYNLRAMYLSNTFCICAVIIV